MRVKGAALVMAFAALATPARIRQSAGPDQQQQPQTPAFRSTISLQTVFELTGGVASIAEPGAAAIAVFCINAKEDIIASSIQHADLKLSPMAFQKALDSGIPYKVRIPTAPSVRRVRAVVYDYEVDLVGSSDPGMR